MKVTEHPLYRRWTWMRQSVYNPNAPEYPKQGARGVCIDPAFDNFWQFAGIVETELGPCPGPGYKLARRDIHGNWTIKNMAWSTSLEVGARLDETIRVRYKGKTRHLKEWARALGYNYHTIVERYHRGWSTRDMLTIPTLNTGERRVKRA